MAHGRSIFVAALTARFKSACECRAGLLGIVSPHDVRGLLLFQHYLASPPQALMAIKDALQTIGIDAPAAGDLASKARITSCPILDCSMRYLGDLSRPSR